MSPLRVAALRALYRLARVLAWVGLAGLGLRVAETAWRWFVLPGEPRSW